MTYNDIISTLEFNNMIVQKGDEFEIIINSEQDIKSKRLCAKPELLTWVPYMVATKGDAGILNIPREEYKYKYDAIPLDATILDTTSSSMLRHHQLKRKKSTIANGSNRRRLTRSSNK